MDNCISRKRIRKEAGRRWTKEDKQLLLAIISENPWKFEKPTAQIYYENVIEQNPRFEEYGWKAMRDKLRNLRATYTKAVDWLKNMGSGLNEEDAEMSIKSYMLKTCEDFDTLHNIFSTRNNIVLPHIYETAELVSSPSPPEFVVKSQPPEFVVESPPPEFVVKSQSPEFIVESPPPEFVVESPPPEFVVESPPSTQSHKKQRVQSNNLTYFLAQVQTEKTAYLREKLQFLKNTEERKLRLEEKQVALEKQKLDLERERMKEEFRLKEMELKNNFELSKMRLEREMTLKEKEFEQKYKK